MDLLASSFDGIGKSTNFGFELVSTMAKVGIFNLRASARAMCSLRISTIKTAAGCLVISEIEPKVFSSFSLCLVLKSFSLLFNVSHEPSDFILSIVAILRIDFLVV